MTPSNARAYDSCLLSDCLKERVYGGATHRNQTVQTDTPSQTHQTVKTAKTVETQQTLETIHRPQFGVTRASHSALNPRRRESSPGQLSMGFKPARPARAAKAAKHLKSDQYLKQNLEIAGWILTDPTAHGGEESLMVRWARLVADRAATEAAQA